MPKLYDGPGWRYDADGEEVSGFLEGTAYQPHDRDYHFDHAGEQHPGSLRDCSSCRGAMEIPDDACVLDGEVYPEHDFPPEGEGNECRRCGAEAED